MTNFPLVTCSALVGDFNVWWEGEDVFGSADGRLRNPGGDFEMGHSLGAPTRPNPNDIRGLGCHLVLPEPGKIL